jgi:hypothetical protein
MRCEVRNPRETARMRTRTRTRTRIRTTMMIMAASTG